MIIHLHIPYTIKLNYPINSLHIIPFFSYLFKILFKILSIMKSLFIYLEYFFISVDI